MTRSCFFCVWVNAENHGHQDLKDKIVHLCMCGWLQKIQEYQDLKDEIMLLRITVPLSMFCLDCVNLNNELALRAQRLKERLVAFEVDENRDLNRS